MYAEQQDRPESATQQRWHQRLDKVYNDLRHVARALLNGERAGHTLQTTALVNEAFLRVGTRSDLGDLDRNHCIKLFARAMRQVLVDHARGHRSRKRGGDWEKIALQASLLSYEDTSIDVLALDEALDRLARIDYRGARIVELRFFGGLSVEQTAEVLDIAPRTVREDWRIARMWLHSELTRGPEHER